MATIAQADKAGRETRSLAPVRHDQVHPDSPGNGLSDGAAILPRLCPTLTINPDRVDAEQLASVSFNPTAWLASLVAIGGGYALASGRKLWLVVDHCPADELTSVMSQVVGHTDRVEAVRVAIERHQAGETV